METNAADEAFRAEVRAFLESELTDELRAAGEKRTSVWQEIESSMAWQSILNSRGWAAPDWPVEYGGTDWSLSQKYIFAQECAAAGTPGIIPMGLKMCGPMLIGYGTEEQKAHYLPRMLRGDDIWCQGYSEPGSGSDLASLKTQAVADGDDYVVNGTKIWTSYAQHANMIFALVRTDAESKPQQGISFLLIDMQTPGITVKPIINLEGSHELNQVFFDNVRVPKANRVGAENQGWTVAKYLLEFERFSMSSVELRRLLSKIAKLGCLTQDGAPFADHPEFQARYQALAVEAAGLEGSEQRVLRQLSAGNSPGSVSSVLNARSSEVLQAADMLGVEVAAYYGMPLQPDALRAVPSEPVVGPEEAVTMTASFLNNRMRTIAGGSAEIQRNIVAKSILGL